VILAIIWGALDESLILVPKKRGYYIVVYRVLYAKSEKQRTNEPNRVDRSPNDNSKSQFYFSDRFCQAESNNCCRSLQYVQRVSWQNLKSTIVDC
jgi:hypothetical protein